MGVWGKPQSSESTHKWRRMLSGVHSIMMEKEPRLVKVWGVHAHPPFTISSITKKVAVYAPAESADTLPFISTPMIERYHPASLDLHESGTIG